MNAYRYGAIRVSALAGLKGLFGSAIAPICGALVVACGDGASSTPATSANSGGGGAAAGGHGAQAGLAGSDNSAGGGTSAGAAGGAGQLADAGAGGANLCEASTLDCNANASDGCETDGTTRDHCGACDVQCETEAYCALGRCVKPRAAVFKVLGATINDFALGKAGSLYGTGVLREPFDFGNGLRSPSGNSDIFIVKYLPSGELGWVKTFGAQQYNIGYGIALDEDENVYVTGSLRGSADFGAGVLGAGTATGADVFIASYDTDGEYRFAVTHGSSGSNLDEGAAITVGKERVYIAGRAGAGMNFGGGTLGTLPSSAYGFVAAFDRKTGAFAWSKGFEQPNSSSGYFEFSDLVIDSAERLYVAGNFRGRINLGSGELTSSEVLVADVRVRTESGFVASYTGTTGAFRWLQLQDGPNSDRTAALAVDSEDNVYAVGSFIVQPNFGAGIRTSSEGLDYKLFLVSYKSNGNHRFDVVGRNEGPYSSSAAQGVAVQNGSVCVSASATGNVEILGATAQSSQSSANPSVPSEDMGLFCFSSDLGKFRFGRTFGGGSNDSSGRLAASNGAWVMAGRPVGVISIEDTELEPANASGSALLTITE